MKSLKKDIFTEAYQILLKESKNPSFIKKKGEMKKSLSKVVSINDLRMKAKDNKSYEQLALKASSNLGGPADNLKSALRYLEQSAMEGGEENVVDNINDVRDLVVVKESDMDDEVDVVGSTNMPRGMGYPNKDMEKRQKWDFTDFVADRGEGQESDFSDPKIYPLNVTAYDAVRRYGGPEEGGWYYTSEEVIESIVVNSGAELDSATDKLFDKFSNSVDGLFRVYVEKEKGSQELKERPHYESKEVSAETIEEGYSGFGLLDSDTASDVMQDIGKAILNVLKKNISFNGQGANTDGIINVAMIYDEVLTKIMLSNRTSTFIDLEEYLGDVVLPKLEQFLEKESASKDWDSEKNKRDHLKAWESLLSRLDSKYMKISGT